MSAIHLSELTPKFSSLTPTIRPHALAVDCVLDQSQDLDFDSLIYNPEQPPEVGHHYHPLTNNATEARREKQLFQLANAKVRV